jgi:hypothetical protein
LLTKDKYGKTAGQLTAACANIQVFLMLWGCAKGQRTPDELNSKLGIGRYLEKDCLTSGCIQGENRGLNILWDWTKEVLTPEDISNKFLLAKDDSERTA